MEMSKNSIISTPESGRSSFVFYRSFQTAINRLPEGGQLEIYRAIALYGLNHEEPDLDGYPAAIFDIVRPQLDANFKRYENGCKGAEFGERGGAPKGNQNARKQPQNNPKSTPNDNDNVNDNDKEEGIVKGKRSAFSPPSLSDLETYMTENGYTIDPQQFIDFYESKGWMIGKNKMKDWQAAVRTWARRPDAAPNPQAHEAAKRYFDE